MGGPAAAAVANAVADGGSNSPAAEGPGGAADEASAAPAEEDGCAYFASVRESQAALDADGATVLAQLAHLANDLPPPGTPAAEPPMMTMATATAVLRQEDKGEEEEAEASAGPAGDDELPLAAQELPASKEWGSFSEPSSSSCSGGGKVVDLFALD